MFFTRITPLLLIASCAFVAEQVNAEHRRESRSGDGLPLPEVDGTDRDPEERKRSRDETVCEDQARWCKKIGNKLPLSRCYKAARKRCCHTCSKMRLPITECPYGDKESFCSELGTTRPTSECYSYNATCCQTCHLLNSGITGCPFGDRVAWCSSIGDRYSVFSCYESESQCCDTCGRFRSNIPECPYGDRLTWCGGIGHYFSDEHCRNQNRRVCCSTCHKLGIPLPTTPVVHTTPATQRYANATVHPNSTTLFSVISNITINNDTEAASVGNQENITDLRPKPGEEFVNITQTDDNSTYSYEEITQITPSVTIGSKLEGNLTEDNISSPNPSIILYPEIHDTKSGSSSPSRGIEISMYPSTPLPTDRPHRHGNGQKGHKLRDSHRKHHHRSTISPPNTDNHNDTVLIGDPSLGDFNYTNVTITTELIPVIQNDLNFIQNETETDELGNTYHGRPKYLDPSQEFFEDSLFSSGQTQRVLSSIYYFNFILLFIHSLFFVKCNR